MEQRHDIVVIGAGIAGVATALYLMKLGRNVLLLDRRKPGQETSFGNAGVIGSGYVLPFGFPPLSRIPNILLGRDTMARVRYADLPRLLPWIATFYLNSRSKPRGELGKLLYPLVAPAIAEHRNLMQGTDAEKHMGMGKQITLYRNESGFQDDALSRAIAKELGVPFNVMERDAFCELEPHIKPVFHKIVQWPASAHLNNPGAVVTAYADRLTREGGAFLQTETRALQPAKDGGWTIATNHGGLHAAHIVICAGPWSLQLLKPLGYDFPMIVKRGYHQHYRYANGAALSHALTDAEHGYVLAPMEQGCRLTTGAEFAALGAPPNSAQIDLCLPRAQELLSLGSAIETTPWLGNRPCFANSLPVLGPAPKHQGLWLNFGHGHMGMTIGPATGRLLAEMMCGMRPFCDPQPYRPVRFTC